MQTNFSAEQLKDPAMQSSEKILRSCVHCGFCTATCPTYLLRGDELDSPRGRIYLMKDMLENNKPANAEVVKHIDRCLSCLSCMTTCPSGVHYMHLVDHARAYIEKTYDRPLPDKLMRRLLGVVLPNRKLFRFALTLGRVGSPMRGFFKRLPGGERLDAMLALLPKKLPKKSTAPKGEVVGPRRGRVVLLEGCAQSVLRPSINEATVRLLNRFGVEVIFASGEKCCGALVHHLGQGDASHAYARNNIDVWTREMAGEGIDAILISASGCGTTIKDYGFMFRDDPAYAENAKRVSAMAKDISEFLVTLDLPESEKRGLTVAYHSACSMQHGQQIRDQPKTLLKRAGFTVKDVPEGHICCGSAGTYNILQPEFAGELRDRKVKNIARTNPDVIATGNIGCITHISGGTAIPIVHTVELLDWVTGGPMPAELAGVAARATAGAPLQAAE